MRLNDDQWALVLDWMRKLHTLEYAHRYESTRKERLNLMLGVPVVVASALAGVHVVAPGLETPLARAATGLGAGAVGVLAALLTFFKPAEVAEKHRAASFKYESLRHRLEFLLTFDRDSEDITEKLSRFKEDWDVLATMNVTNRTWFRAKVRVTEVGTYPASLRISAVSKSDPQTASRERHSDVDL